jgi:hypothetical protein
MIRRILPVSIVVSCAALAMGYILGELWAWIPAIVAVGVVWLFGQWRAWGWTASMGLICGAGLAAAGVMLDLALGWMLVGLVATLTAWDLAYLALRLRGVERAEESRLVERRHLQRLLMVSGAGLVLPVVALEIEFGFSLGVALLLGLLVFVGLSQAVLFLRRETG